MRRRTKPRVVWLPITNTNSVDGASTNRSAIQFQFFQVASNAQGSIGGIEIPCVLDGIQSSPLDTTSSLADIENSGYRLRRIVGEVWVFCSQSNESTGALYCVTAGFIIRKIDTSTGTSIASFLGQQEVSLDDVENTMDPWIWRRSWMMSDDGNIPAPFTPLDNTVFNQEPHNNFTKGNGGLHSGPHVDQKTARIVGPEERLFLDFTATTMLASPGNGPTTFLVASNLRVLASMRSNIGNRRNASR